MNIVIAGSRNFTDYELLELTITEWAKRNPQINQDEVTIISGNAKGADQLGERFAKEYGLKLEVYPADWNTHGKSAGYKRNVQMAEVADHAFIFWDGNSKGTYHMIQLLDKLEITHQVIIYSDVPWEE